MRAGGYASIFDANATTLGRSSAYAATAEIRRMECPLGEERSVALGGAYNLRDLGGYLVDGGWRVRRRRLFRSDALHDVTDDDIRELRKLGIRTIVDLRHPSEIAFTGRGLLTSESVQFISTCQEESPRARTERGSTLDAAYLVRRYLEYLEMESGTFIKAMQVIADADKLPLVFNCFFGKDRTGVLSALLLELLGVHRDQVVLDYANSTVPMQALLEHLRKNDLYRETLVATPSVVLDSSPETMRSFLEEVDARYGGCRSWITDAGVSIGDQERLKVALLEPSPLVVDESTKLGR